MASVNLYFVFMLFICVTRVWADSNSCTHGTCAAGEATELSQWLQKCGSEFEQYAPILAANDLFSVEDLRVVAEDPVIFAELLNAVVMKMTTLVAKAKARLAFKFQVDALLSRYKYRRFYSEEQIAANRAKVPPKGTSEAMVDAARQGNADELQAIVEQWFANPVLNFLPADEQSKYRGTPLIEASANGHIECVRILVAQPGIDISKGIEERAGPAVFHVTALLAASVRCQVDVVDLLCGLPGIEDSINTEGLGGMGPHTSYSAACNAYSGPDKEERITRIRGFLEANGGGYSNIDLFVASAQGDVDRVERICAQPGMDVNVNEVIYAHLGHTLQSAICIQCSRSDLSSSNDIEGRTAKIRDILHGRGYKYTEIDLLHASEQCDVELVQKICSVPGIDVNKVVSRNDITGKRPYSVVCEERGYTDREEKKRKTNQIRQVLIAGGAKLDEEDLMQASKEGDVDAVEFISNLPGIDVNKLKDGVSPYSQACQYCHDGGIGEEKLERKNRIRAILVEKGARFTELDLHEASEEGDLEAVERICAQPGINVSDKKYDGSTPHIRAALRYVGNREAREKRKREIRAVLEAKGYKLTQSDLFLASKEGDVDLVQKLSSLPGIDVNKADTEGNTPYKLACTKCSGSDEEERRKLIRDILVAKGATKPWW